jgi:xanthine dehydrogenase small subunit
MAAIPKRAKHCEKILLNSNFSEIILKAQMSLEKDFQPIDDMRASKNYRIEIAKNLLMKCFIEINSNKLIRLSY